jgi:hypothetical protein
MLYSDFYYSDDILHGRKIKKMFTSLCEQIIQDDKKTLGFHYERFKYHDSPLFGKETQAVPLIAISLNKIGAECIFPEFSYKSNNTDQRFIDLYFCYEKEEYFLEAKHGWYCLSENTSDNVHSAVVKSFKNMLQQMRQNKKEFRDEEYINFGFMPIVCYTAQSKSRGDYETSDILEKFNHLIDKRSGMQMLGFEYKIEDNVIKSRKDDEDKPNIIYKIIFLGLFQSKNLKQQN